jgi:hypothetical protein
MAVGLYVVMPYRPPAVQTGLPNISWQQATPDHQGLGQTDILVEVV